MSPAEAAALLKVSQDTIIRLCKDGKLAHILIGKQYRIFKTAVERLIGQPIPPATDEE